MLADYYFYGEWEGNKTEAEELTDALKKHVLAQGRFNSTQLNAVKAEAQRVFTCIEDPVVARPSGSVNR